MPGCFLFYEPSRRKWEVLFLSTKDNPEKDDFCNIVIPISVQG